MAGSRKPTSRKGKVLKMEATSDPLFPFIQFEHRGQNYYMEFNMDMILMVKNRTGHSVLTDGLDMKVFNEDPLYFIETVYAALTCINDEGIPTKAKVTQRALTFDQVKALIAPRDMLPLYGKLCEAYLKAMDPSGNLLDEEENKQAQEEQAQDPEQPSVGTSSSNTGQ